MSACFKYIAFDTAFSCILLLLMASVYAVIYVLRWGPSGVDQALLGCHTSACHTASVYLADLLDDNVDPCTDFYSHVCKKWLTQHERSHFIDGYQASVFIELQRSLNSLQSFTLGDGMQQSLEVWKELFQSCLEFMLVLRTDLGHDVDSAVRLTNLSEILTSTTSLDALKRAVSLLLSTGIDTVIRVSPSKVNGQTLLEVSSGPPLGIAFGAYDTEREFEYYAKNVIHLLSETFERSAIDETFTLTAVMNLDSAMKALLHKESSEDSWVNISSSTKTSDILEEVLKSPLETFSQNLRTPFVHDRVLVRDYNTTRLVLKLLESSPVNVTSWYLALMALAPALRFDFMKRVGVRSLPTVRRNCFGVVSQAMSPNWPLLVATLLNHTNLELAETIFERLKDFVLSGADFRWIGDVTRAMAREKIRKVALVSPTKLYRNHDDITITRKSGTLKSHDFFYNLLTLRRDRRLIAFENPPSSLKATLSRLEFEGRAMYDGRIDRIFLPLLFQRPPIFYAANVAAHFNYAVLGALLGNLLTLAISPYSLGRDRNSSWWPRDAFREFSYRISCYRLLGENISGNPGLTDIDMKTLELRREVFIWLRGVRIAYEAMKHDFYKTASPITIWKHWKSAQQTFFRRFCLMSCGRGSGDPLYPEEKCMLPLLNMPEFLGAFDCPKTSPISQREGCQLF